MTYRFQLGAKEDGPGATAGAINKERRPLLSEASPVPWEEEGYSDLQTA
jgi:hypothetical protein